jgi:hypothetical protein
LLSQAKGKGNNGIMLTETEKPKLIKFTPFSSHTAIQLSFSAAVSHFFHSHPRTNIQKTSEACLICSYETEKKDNFSKNGEI